MSKKGKHGFQLGPFRSVEEVAKELKELDKKNQPRIQNIPVRTETGLRIREAFKDHNGPRVDLNYNQIELRVMASMIAEFKLKHPEAALGMTDEEIFKEITRAPARSVQAFTKVAKDTKSTGRRPKSELYKKFYGKKD